MGKTWQNRTLIISAPVLSATKWWRYQPCKDVVIGKLAICKAPYLGSLTSVFSFFLQEESPACMEVGTAEVGGLDYRAPRTEKRCTLPGSWEASWSSERLFSLFFMVPSR